MQHSILRFLGLVLFSALLTAVIIHQPVSQRDNEQRERRSDGMDDPDGLAAWELKRLQDPTTGMIPVGIRYAELEFSKKLPAAPNDRSLDFTNRGPYNVGGRTRALAMDVTNSNILIAGSVSGSIYRSTNGGQTWTPSDVPSVSQGIVSVAQDTRSGHTNTWYACSGEAYGTSASGNSSNSFYLGNGLYKSTDGGIAWSNITSTATNNVGFDTHFDVTWQVKIDPSRMDSDIVFAAVYGGVYRSNNGGSTWKRVAGHAFNASTTSYFTGVEVTPTGKVFAALSDDGGNSKGIWRSDNGITFTNILPDSFPTAYNRIVMAYAPSDENQIYFLANTPGFGQPDTNYVGDVEWNSLWKYTYVSGDGSDTGGVWENRSVNLPTTGGPFDKFQVQGSYDMLVTVKPDDPNFVVIGGTNLYRSTDGFATYNNWRFIGGYKINTHLPVVESYPNHHSDQHMAFFHTDDYNKLYSSNDGGVWRTDDVNADTVSWSSLNNGYLTTQFYTLAIDNASPGDSTIIGGLQDNGTFFTNSNSSTDPWFHSNGGDGSYCAIADNKSVYYFSIQLGKMRRCIVDANGNVGAFARIDPRDAKGFQFINPYILDPVDQNIMYLPAGHKMWRNDNLAGIPMINNWDSITTNWMTYPDTCTVDQGEITAVACSVNPAHIVYYGTDKKLLYKVINANTGNPTRIDITGYSPFSQAFPSTGYINCIAVDPVNADNVVVVFSNYNVVSLFATTDGGTTWEKVGGNLEDSPVTGSGNGPSCRWLSIMHLNDGTLYFVATSTGLYATDTLQGVNTVWSKQSVNTIGNTVCDMVLTRPSDGLVVVGTHGNGVFTSHITSVNQAVGIRKMHRVVNNLQLFPNPTSTEEPILSFTTINTSPINVDIRDATGRKVMSYDNIVTHTGSNSLPLRNTARIGKGIYFVRLEQNGQSQSIKWIKL